MEEILQHQGCIKPCKYGIFTISTGAGFLPSTACPKSTPRHIHNRPLLPAAYSQTRSVKQPLQPRQSSTKKHHHGPWRSSAPLQWNLSPGCSPLRPNRNAVWSRGDRSQWQRIFFGGNATFFDDFDSDLLVAISSLSQLQCTLLWSCTRLGILSIAQIDGLHCAFITGANGIIKPIRWKQETLRAQHNIRRMSRDEVAKAASQGCPGKVRSKSFSISYRHRCHGISLAAGRHAMEYCFCNEPRSKWKCQNLEIRKDLVPA